MNKRNDYATQLRLANEDLSPLNMELRILSNDDGFHDIALLEWDPDGSHTTHCYAENLFEEELSDSITEAWAQARRYSDTISFRRLTGWTHDMPALVMSLTTVSLFFHDFDTHSIESLDNAESIDLYEDRHGEFLVLEADYDTAIRQIREHDELGIEH